MALGKKGFEEVLQVSVFTVHGSSGRVGNVVMGFWSFFVRLEKGKETN